MALARTSFPQHLTMLQLSSPTGSPCQGPERTFIVKSPHMPGTPAFLTSQALKKNTGDTIISLKHICAIDPKDILMPDHNSYPVFVMHSSFLSAAFSLTNHVFSTPTAPIPGNMSLGSIAMICPGIALPFHLRNTTG